MTLYRKRSWWCDGCQAWHGLSQDVEAETPQAGSWCGRSVRRALRNGRNVNLPGYILDSFRREMGRATA